MDCYTSLPQSRLFSKFYKCFNRFITFLYGFEVELNETFLIFAFKREAKKFLKQ